MVFSALAIAIIAFLGQVQVSVIDAPSIVARDGGGQSYEAAAKATACVERHASVELTRAAATDTIVLTHELLHVADCADNGLYDGSLEPGGSITLPTDCAHSWVYWALRHPEQAIQLIAALPRELLRKH